MLDDRAGAIGEGESRRRAIVSWLLAAPQLVDGANAGGVAGAVDVDGSATYVYPEITGYYLQWLAWRGAREGVQPMLASRAEAAQRWLVGWSAGSDFPHTRIYLRDAAVDWRNTALFCFDVAMVLRGLAAASRSGLIRVNDALIERLVAMLSQLIADDGVFVACRTVPGAELPERWSTRRGAFLAKAAAGVLHAAARLAAVNDALHTAAEATREASLRWLVEQPHDETHPLLYAIEGLVGTPDVRSGTTDHCIDCIDRLLKTVSAAGTLAESSVSSVERMDIVAQTVRAANVLHAIEPRWRADPHVLARMVHALARNVAAGGGAAFTAANAASSNVWASMFTEQALAFSRCSAPELLRYRALLV